MEHFTPLKSLTRVTPHWKLKCWVSSKTKVFEFNKAGKSYKKFDIILQDKSGDRIHCVFWNEATKWCDELQEGKMYTFSNGTVSVSKKKFTEVSHNYEITFYDDSQIKAVDNAETSCFVKKYDIMTLRDIRNSMREMPYRADVLVITKSISEKKEIQTKAGEAKSIVTVNLIDDTQNEIDMILWEEDADAAHDNFPVGRAIVLASVNVREYQDAKTLQFANRTSIVTDYKDERCLELDTWYMNNTNSHFESLSTRISSGFNSSGYDDTISCITDVKSAAYDEKFWIVADVAKVHWKTREGKSRLMYKSCPTCRKSLKQLNDTDDIYSCLNCNKENFTNFTWRYSCRIEMIDTSGSLVLHCFGDPVELVLNKVKCDVINKMSAPEKGDFFDNTCIFQQKFKVQVCKKLDVINGEEKTSFKLIRALPFIYHNAAIELIHELEQNISVDFDNDDDCPHDEKLSQLQKGDQFGERDTADSIVFEYVPETKRFKSELSC